MSWIIKPGAIPHLEHLWQPQIDWENAAAEYAGIFNDLTRMLADPGTPCSSERTWSVKIDDAVSIRIGRSVWDYDQSVFVGYKGMNSPVCYKESEIEAFYGNKPYKNVLKMALRLAWDLLDGIAPGERVSLQLAVLHPTSESDEDLCAPTTLKPNVIEYKMNYGDDEDKYFVYVPVSLTYLKEHSIIEPVSITQDHDVLYPDVYQNPSIHRIDTTLKFTSVYPDITAEMGRAMQQYGKMLIGESFQRVAGHEPLMKIFLNSFIRTRTPMSNVDCNHYCRFLRSREEEEKAKYVEANYWHFTNAFTLCQYLFNVVSMTTINCNFESAGVRASQPEGIVVTRPLRNGSMVSFKLVSPNFSADNFDRWDPSSPDE